MTQLSRPWDEEKQDFIPPQLDPEYIVIRTEPAHDKKTNGNGATSFGSDKHAIAKVGALEGIRHHEGRCVLYDGMDGQYVAIGRVIEKTGNHDHFEHPIRIAPLGDAERQSLHDDIRRLIQLEGDFSVQHLVISHYR
jgi:hypothetical protein